MELTITRACPFCQFDVNLLDIHSFLIFFPRAHDEGHGLLVAKIGPHWCSYYQAGKTFPNLEISDIGESRGRALLIHQGCFGKVKGLSYRQIRTLIDLIEPTFPAPSESASLVRPFMKNLDTSGAFVPPSNTVEDKECTVGQRLDRLPIEILYSIYKYDIGRLLFIMETASQIPKTTSYEFPEHRFSKTLLKVKDDIVDIHLVDIGGKTYIGNITTPKPCFPGQMRNTLEESKCRQVYGINNSKYLAVKSDAVGVIDIAFRKTQNGPDWIFGHSAYPFCTSISITHLTDTACKPTILRLFRDSLKCRAITPHSASAAVPYFKTRRAPPQGSYVSFAIPTMHSRIRDELINGIPDAYFAEATYASFADMRNIKFSFNDESGPGRFEVNTKLGDKRDGEVEIEFPSPPQAVRFIPFNYKGSFCQLFLQFEVDGQWQPPSPSSLSLTLPPIEIHNVLGIWWAEWTCWAPIRIGVVVSDEATLNKIVVPNFELGIMQRRILRRARKH